MREKKMNNRRNMTKWSEEEIRKKEVKERERGSDSWKRKKRTGAKGESKRGMEGRRRRR